MDKKFKNIFKNHLAPKNDMWFENWGLNGIYPKNNYRI